MFIKEVVLDGFKSYAKRTVIAGWDTQFNCITGLNGSGKSNVLDAICFVLGITTLSTVRASNQQDLIYKRGQAGISKASVSIVFDNTDVENKPLGFEDARTITITRQVVMGGTSKYLINGHKSQQNQVQALFQSVHLNVNNPNFLIMQGQITKVVNMKPIEILGLIEEAAGTGMYEKERKRAVKEIKDRDAPLQETNSLLEEEVRPKLERLRAQKRDFLEYQNCAAAAEELEKVVAGSYYQVSQRKLADLLAKAERSDAAAEELRALINSESEDIAQLELKCSELQSKQKTETTVALESQIQDLQQEHVKLATSLELKQQQLQENSESQLKLTREIETLNIELQSHTAKVEEFETHHRNLCVMFERQNKFVAEKRELITGLKTGISTTGQKETGFAYASKRAREELADLEQKLEDLQSEGQRIELQIQNADVSDTFESLKSRLEHLETEISKRNQSLSSLQPEIDRITVLRNELSTLRDSEAKVNRSIDRLVAANPDLESPSTSNGSSPGDTAGIIGKVAHVFKLKPEHKDKANALTVTAGRGLWDLVVANDKIGAQVLKNARKRITVLPLNRMSSKRIPAQRVSQIDPGHAWLAMDLIEYDPELEPIMTHVFGRTVICATSAVAERAAFEFKVRSVTLEGDTYDPRGVISGGATNNSNNNSGNANGNNGTGDSIFTTVAQYMDLVNQKSTTSQSISLICEQLETSNSMTTQSQQLIRELELLRHESELAQTQLKEITQANERNSSLQSRLQTIRSSEIPSTTELIKEAQLHLTKTLNDAADFQNNREGKLNEITNELNEAVTKAHDLERQVESERKDHLTNKSELARLTAEIDQNKDDLQLAKTSINELNTEINEITSTLNGLSRDLEALNSELVSAMSTAANLTSELANTESTLSSLRNLVAEQRLELQRTQHSIEKRNASVNAEQKTVANLLSKWPWCANVNLPEYKQGAELDELAKQLENEKRRISSLRSRVDSSVVMMIERLENDEIELRRRIATILEDRRKLSESMEVLNEKRTATIESVWRNVSDNFGEIFGDLLPGSYAELIPLGDNPIQNGFNLHVRLGATWKEGLTELSGGQRSLVALALILALLKFHPAPVYILDEVDAALDVHHTRNIGHIIKTRFKRSQFVVVSLKDDMFTNANRIFQTKFVDGTSTIHRTQ